MICAAALGLALAFTGCQTADAPAASSAPSTAGGISLVTSYIGATSLAANDSGLYQIQANPQEGSNILYTDFASGQTVYLCSRPECMHGDDTCASWFPFATGSLFQDAGAQYLFCVGSADPLSETAETIWRMCADGQEREAFYECAAYESLTDAIAAGGDFLYFTTRTVDPETQQIEKTIYKANIYDKTVSPLTTCGNADWLMSAFDDQLVLQLSEEDDSGVQYVTLDVNDGTKTTVYTASFAQDGRVRTFPHGEELYILRPVSDAQADLSRLHIPTGQTQELAQGLAYFGPDVTWPHGVYAGFLDITTYDTRANDPANIPCYHYAVHCETGEVRQLSLMYKMNEAESFVQILAEAGDDFLVCNGIQNVTMMLVGPDRAYYEAIVSVPTYALMRQDDYWANQPNYRAITPP